MPTVLIVDDHPSFRASAHALLEAEGFEVVGEAEDGASALAAAERLRPEVVLLDVELPDIDGLELAARLTAAGDGPRVVLVSSRDCSDYGPLVGRCGACGFVPKGELSGGAARASRLMRLTWRPLLLALLALLLGAGHLALVLTSDYEESKALAATLPLVVGWSFVASGLVARRERPESRFGTLLLLVGFLWFSGSLLHTNAEVPFTIGVAAANVSIPVFVQALLAFPGGRLRSPLEWGLVALTWVDVVALQVVELLFHDREGCECPGNAFLIVPSDAAGDAVSLAQNVLGLLLTGGVIAVLARRWQRASVPRRRALGPAFLAGIVTGLAFAAFLVADAVSSPAGGPLNWLAIGALATLPLGFLAGLLRTRLARPGVRLLRAAGGELAPAQAQEGLRRALGDPTLRLAYWLEESRRYVDVIRPGLRMVCRKPRRSRSRMSSARSPTLSASPRAPSTSSSWARAISSGGRIASSSSRERPIVAFMPSMWPASSCGPASSERMTASVAERGAELGGDRLHSVLVLGLREPGAARASEAAAARRDHHRRRRRDRCDAPLTD